ncbi:MAG: hypothetical protein ACLP9L_32885 [Thermoguttaceae bacterium]
MPGVCIPEVPDPVAETSMELNSGCCRTPPNGDAAAQPTDLEDGDSSAEEFVADDEEVDDAEALGKELKEKVELIRKLAQHADCQEIEQRYEINLHCRDVLDNVSKFGDGAVQKLTDALGWKKTTIYDYATVAGAWKSKEEAVAAAKAMNRGWRHLVEIAGAPAEKQQVLINAVRAADMSLRTLKEHKKRISPAAGRTKPAPSLEDTTPSISLVEAIEDFSDAVTYFEKHGIPLADRLAEAVAKAELIDITPEFVKDLKKLRGWIEAIYQKSIDRIDTCLAAGKQTKAKRKATTPTVKPKTRESIAADRNAEVVSPA